MDHSTIVPEEPDSSNHAAVAAEDSAVEQQQSRLTGLHEVVEDASKGDAVVTVVEIEAETSAVRVIAVVRAVDENAGHWVDESRVVG